MSDPIKKTMCRTLVDLVTRHAVADDTRVGVLDMNFPLPLVPAVIQADCTPALERRLTSKITSRIPNDGLDLRVGIQEINDDTSVVVHIPIVEASSAYFDMQQRDEVYRLQIKNGYKALFAAAVIYKRMHVVCILTDSPYVDVILCISVFADIYKTWIPYLPAGCVVHFPELAANPRWLDWFNKCFANTPLTVLYKTS